MINKDKVTKAVIVSEQILQDMSKLKESFNLNDTIITTYSYETEINLKNFNNFCSYDVVNTICAIVMGLYKEKCCEKGFFEKEVFKRLGKDYENNLNLKLLKINKEVKVYNNLNECVYNTSKNIFLNNKNKLFIYNKNDESLTK